MMPLIAAEPVATEANLLLRLAFGLPVIAVMLWFVALFMRPRTVWVPADEDDTDLDSGTQEDKPAGSPSTDRSSRPAAPDE